MWTMEANITTVQWNNMVAVCNYTSLLTVCVCVYVCMRAILQEVIVQGECWAESQNTETCFSFRKQNLPFTDSE